MISCNHWTDWKCEYEMENIILRHFGQLPSVVAFIWKIYLKIISVFETKNLWAYKNKCSTFLVYLLSRYMHCAFCLLYSRRYCSQSNEMLENVWFPAWFFPLWSYSLSTSQWNDERSPLGLKIFLDSFGERPTIYFIKFIGGWK